MDNLAGELKRFPIPMKGKKELEALAPYLQKESIVTSIHGQGPHDKAKTCWFILTNHNVFIVVKASMMGAASVIALPLKDIESAIENRGMLLADLVLMSKGIKYTLYSAGKNQTKDFVEYFNKRKAELLHPEESVSKETVSEETVSEETPQPVEQSAPQTITPQLITEAQQKKKRGCITRIAQIFLLLIVLSAIGKTFTEDKKTVTPVYKILKEEHNKLGGGKRFSYEISVPLGLSKDELTQLLTNAAWELQKKKDASGIWILAYREDDKERSGGFSAGRCILAPDGDWAKAVTSNSNLKIKVDIAKAYTYDNKQFEIGSKLFVKKDAILHNDQGENLPQLKKALK